jgi:hypothetical protein
MVFNDFCEAGILLDVQLIVYFDLVIDLHT